jgi:hypothetical protein
MRSFFLAVAVLLIGSCTHTQQTRETPAHVLAQVMISALTPTQQGRPGYAWAAVEARIAPPVRWHGEAFPPEVLEGTGLQRNGWLAVPGRQFDVMIQGSFQEVRLVSVDVNDAIVTEALLAELRAAGAEVSGAGDDETAMFYYVAVPGRETAQLEARRRCSPYGSRAAHHCRSIMTWNYEPQ